MSLTLQLRIHFDAESRENVRSLSLFLIRYIYAPTYAPLTPPLVCRFLVHTADDHMRALHSAADHLHLWRSYLQSVNGVGQRCHHRGLICSSDWITEVHSCYVSGSDCDPPITALWYDDVIFTVACFCHRSSFFLAPYCRSCPPFCHVRTQDHCWESLIIQLSFWTAANQAQCSLRPQTADTLP